MTTEQQEGEGTAMLHVLYKTPDEERAFQGRLRTWMTDEKISDGVVGDMNGIYYWRGHFADRVDSRLRDLKGTALTPRALQMIEKDVFRELSRDKGAIASTKRAGERGLAEPHRRKRRGEESNVVSISDSPLGRTDAGRYGPMPGGYGYGDGR